MEPELTKLQFATDPGTHMAYHAYGHHICKLSRQKKGGKEKKRRTLSPGPSPNPSPMSLVV